MWVIDLNSDLGESFGDWKMGMDEEVMSSISSSNVACGLKGGVLNGFKSGRLLGTDPRAQLAAEVAGGMVGAVAASGLLGGEGITGGLIAIGEDLSFLVR